MLTINEQGILEEQSFTNQTLNWGDVYQFNHARRGKVIATLVAEDHDWFFVELATELDTPNGYMEPGERLPLRKSLVYSIDLF